MKFIRHHEYEKLYDAYNLMLLRYNRERTSEFCSSDAKDKSIFDSLYDRVSYTDEILAPFFYLHNGRSAVGELIAELAEKKMNSVTVEVFAELLADTELMQDRLISVFFGASSEREPAALQIKLAGIDVPYGVKYLFLYFLNDKRAVTTALRRDFLECVAIVEELHMIYSHELGALAASLDAGAFDEELAALENSPQSEDTRLYALSVVDRKLVSVDGYVMRLGVFADKILGDMTGLKLHLTELGRIISDDFRLRLIDLLSEREMYTTEIVDMFGMNMTAIYYHLNMMLNEKVIKSRNVGRRVYYSINREYFERLRSYLERYSK